MILELSDDRALWRFEPVPKWARIAMYESKHGFDLQPECVFTGYKVDVRRVVVPLTKQTLMQWAFGGKECWQVQVWEYAVGYATEKPTWFITLGPESSLEDAEKEAAKVRDLYEKNWDRAGEFSQLLRPGEPRVSLPPKKPEMIPGKPASFKDLQKVHEYEIRREERAARFTVLKTVFPKTAELAEKAELTEDPETKRWLEEESIEAYFAERAPGWSAWVFKAWQRFNPVGMAWMNWLYVWSCNRNSRSSEFNKVDYELAFNWWWGRYFLMTAEQLKEAVFKKTKQLISAEAIKKRRERLGLTTLRPTGPPPRV